MRILLALDGSDSADRARALVTSLAWPDPTIVRVVAALDVTPALWGGPWIPAVPVDADELEAQAVADLTRVVQEARGPWRRRGSPSRPSSFAGALRRRSSTTRDTGGRTSSWWGRGATGRWRRPSWDRFRARSPTTPGARC